MLPVKRILRLSLISLILPLALAGCKKEPRGLCNFYNQCPEPEEKHVFGTKGKDVWGRPMGGEDE